MMHGLSALIHPMVESASQAGAYSAYSSGIIIAISSSSSSNNKKEQQMLQQMLQVQLVWRAAEESRWWAPGPTLQVLGTQTTRGGRPTLLPAVSQATRIP
eukprot:359870-Chlamydomonas_euryale.AAC.3